MPPTILMERELPRAWRNFRMPRALHERLQELLDKQDEAGKLSARERREAGALTELVDILTLLRLRSKPTD